MSMFNQLRSRSIAPAGALLVTLAGCAQHAPAGSDELAPPPSIQESGHELNLSALSGPAAQGNAAAGNVAGQGGVPSGPEVRPAAVSGARLSLRGVTVAFPAGEILKLGAPRAYASPNPIRERVDAGVFATVSSPGAQSGYNLVVELRPIGAGAADEPSLARVREQHSMPGPDGEVSSGEFRAGRFLVLKMNGAWTALAEMAADEASSRVLVRISPSPEAGSKFADRNMELVRDELLGFLKHVELSNRARPTATPMQKKWIRASVPFSDNRDCEVTLPPGWSIENESLGSNPDVVGLARLVGPAGARQSVLRVSVPGCPIEKRGVLIDSMSQFLATRGVDVGADMAVESQYIGPLGLDDFLVTIRPKDNLPNPWPEAVVRGRAR